MSRNVMLMLVASSVCLLAGCNSEPSMDTTKLGPAVNTTVQPADAHPAQAAAANALGNIGAPAVPALSESLGDPDPVVRLQSCRALAYMGLQAKDAVQPLIRALGDPEESVREEAAAALGQIGPPAAPAIPTLMQMLHGGKQ